jgi:hypothetical protein
MALPTIKLPTYELKLPSSGKKIKYRPFIVKERAILLLAMQEDDLDGILRAIDNLFDVCTFGKCKLDDMPIVDSEFLFINIRNKSIGEDLDVIHGCDCGKDNEIRLSLDQLSVEGISGKTDIDLGDNIFLKMKYPTLNHATLLAEGATEDSILKVISSCIDCIIEGDAVHKGEDSTLEELKDFVLGLTQIQLNKIEDFFESIPKIVVHGNYKCKHCGKENEFKLEGLENFFG